MIRAVCFDLDDTLYDHESFVSGAYNHVARLMAARLDIDSESLAAELLMDWKERTSRCADIFSKALRIRNAYSRELELAMVAAYRAYRQPLRLHPGVSQGLASLRRAGISLGLLTDGQPDLQRFKLTSLGLADSFHHVVITGDLGVDRYKPHPEGMLLLLARLHAEPSSTACVGDNPLVDFEAASQLGILTVRVRQGEYAHLVSRPGEVHEEFDSIGQALTWLTNQAATACDGN